MKAAVYKGIRSFEIEDIPILEPGDGQVLIKIDYSSICGSDLHGYTKGMWTAPGKIMGHEYGGTIAKLGPNADPDLKVGDRITGFGLTPCGVCDKCIKGVPHICPNMRGGLPGAFAEYITPTSPGPLKKIYKLPGNVSTLEGAMIEPLSVGLRAAKLAQYGLFDNIVVFGAGTIGLCTMQAVKAICSTSKLIVIDISDKRLELAKELGADFVINPKKVDDVYKAAEEIIGPIKNAYGHPGLADIVFECAGAPVTIAQAQQFVNGGGQIISVALTETSTEIDIPMLIQKEVTWKGSYAYIHDFPEAIELVSTGKVNVKSIITDIYKLDDVNEAFEKQLDSANSIKVVLDCRS